ncbi:hypothetical protein HOP50_05g38840 [Chloropicon primus]|nr:hypothetical protein HOP50_05g38840 [Chloropicon primus]
METSYYSKSGAKGGRRSQAKTKAKAAEFSKAKKRPAKREGSGLVDRTYETFAADLETFLQTLESRLQASVGSHREDLRKFRTSTEERIQKSSDQVQNKLNGFLVGQASDKRRVTTKLKSKGKALQKKLSLTSGKASKLVERLTKKLEESESGEFTTTTTD